jgi:hypothetical protein
MLQVSGLVVYLYCNPKLFVPSVTWDKDVVFKCFAVFAMFEFCLVLLVESIIRLHKGLRLYSLFALRIGIVTYFVFANTNRVVREPKLFLCYCHKYQKSDKPL